MRLLVYGSLRKGGFLHNHYLNRESLGQIVLSGYKMFRVGSYPAICKSDNEDDKIITELYEMNDDEFEPLKRMEEAAGYQTVDESEGKLFIQSEEDQAHRTQVMDGDWINYLKQI